MRKINILLFPFGTEIANEVVRSLLHSKYFNLIYASSDRTLDDECDEYINFLPFIDHADFFSDMQDLIRLREIEYIIPAHDDVAYKLSILENELDAVVVGQCERINQIVRFKNRTYEELREVVLVPEVLVNVSSGDFPVFVKPIVGQGSLNALRLDSIDDYRYFFERHDVSQFLVMEYLSGIEYTIDCFSRNGEVLYFGARTREKIRNGIAVKSRFVEDGNLTSEIQCIAEKISSKLGMDGLWFFQLKEAVDGRLKLLEIASRVSGTMILNRIRGVNFVEIGIYHKMGLPVDVVWNDISILVSRKNDFHFKHNISFDHLYIDFDDVLMLSGDLINTNLMRVIFHAKNCNKKVTLITKNYNRRLTDFLHKFGILYVFNEIIHLDKNQEKASFMREGGVLIDDSFSERQKAISNGHVALGLDAVELLLF